MSDEQILTPEENEAKALQILEGTEGGEITPEKVISEGVGLPPEEVVDYKKKFSESSTEALKIREENKRLMQEKAELEAKLSNKDDDTSLGREYDMDLLSETEKSILKSQKKLEKELQLMKEEKAWTEDFGNAVKQFPKLAERADEFKEFCYQYPKTIDAPTLAKAFLFEEPQEEKQAPKKGLEKPSAGSRQPQSGMSIEDITRLRTSDPKAYIKAIRDGSLKIPE
mgnify:CR=1 FL=1